jgi:hypothetical protein
MMKRDLDFRREAPVTDCPKCQSLREAIAKAGVRAAHALSKNWTGGVYDWSEAKRAPYEAICDLRDHLDRDHAEKKDDR